MSEPRTMPEVRRIVVALDAARIAEEALEAAAGLAAALQAELVGLFVEDIELMRTAQLPFARELGLASAVLRRLETSDMERALRLQAVHSRERLAAAAAALNLQWSFQVVRGQPLAAVFDALEGSDLVVFGRAGRLVQEHRAPSIAARGGGAQTERFRHLSLRPIVTLFDGSERAWHALAVAHALAATARTRLTVLVPAEDAGEFARRRQEARAWLEERDSMARFVQLLGKEMRVVLDAVRKERAAALVWHDPTAPKDRAALRALLSELGCPLVLVS
ncbi:MAG: hypothetical protein FJY54_04395 [Betaproteobacteria bacterium]|nr:hypothetical protein [Betaproteobacteria bacterium]